MIWTAIDIHTNWRRDLALELEIGAACRLDRQLLPPTADPSGIVNLPPDRHLDVGGLHTRALLRVTFWEIYGFQKTLPQYFPSFREAHTEHVGSLRLGRPRPVNWTRVALWCEIECHFWESRVAEGPTILSGEFAVGEISGDMIEQLARFLWENRKALGSQ